MASRPPVAATMGFGAPMSEDGLVTTPLPPQDRAVSRGTAGTDQGPSRDLSPATRPRPDRPGPGPLPRLIATDLDGTLLRSDKTVSPRTVAALAAAERAGIDVVFVTGRPARWMDVVRQCLSRQSVAICANGAAVYDLLTHRLIAVYPLAHANAQAVMTALRAELPGVGFAAEFTDGYAFEAGYAVNNEIRHFLDHGHLAAEILGFSASPMLKLLVRHESFDPDAFLTTAVKVAGAHAQFTRSNPTALLEVSGLTVSKATTLARWCASRGIASHEVTAFGDMPNDLHMLAWAGTSYAVANAHPEVLAATTHRTSSNDQDGVALVIESLLAAGG